MRVIPDKTHGNSIFYRKYEFRSGGKPKKFRSNFLRNELANQILKCCFDTTKMLANLRK